MYVLRDYYRLSINFEVLTKGEDYLVNELQSSNLVMKRPDCRLVLAFCYPAHKVMHKGCLLYTSPSPRDATLSRMPSSA